MLQVAMLYYRKLERPSAAEPWFARIAKIEPNNGAALNFFREYCVAQDDEGRLIDILQTAQRALPETSKDKAQLAREIAKLAEGQANAQKAIEQYKAILRQEPDNVEAREKLKVFYKQTQSHNALVELLRQQLERAPQDRYEERLAILREIASIYREYIKSDTALPSILNRDHSARRAPRRARRGGAPRARRALRKLSRWRDVITYQLKLAEVTPDLEEKKTLYRAQRRRWLEQFSNAQNAAEAYAALLKVAPDDQEARERLEEIYRKRRAWPALYELFAAELARTEGAARIPILSEMAQLAAERLNRGADSVDLYRKILDLDPSRQDAPRRAREAGRARQGLAGARRRARAPHGDAERRRLRSSLRSRSSAPSTPSTSAIRRRPRERGQRVLEIQPGHHRALRVLRDTLPGRQRLPTASSSSTAPRTTWEGLAEVFSSAADRSKENALRVELSYRAAAVYEEAQAARSRVPFVRTHPRHGPEETRAARALIRSTRGREVGALARAVRALIERPTASRRSSSCSKRSSRSPGEAVRSLKRRPACARRAYELAPEAWSRSTCSKNRAGRRVTGQPRRGALDAPERAA